MCVLWCGARGERCVVSMAEQSCYRCLTLLIATHSPLQMYRTHGASAINFAFSRASASETRSKRASGADRGLWPSNENDL